MSLRNVSNLLNKSVSFYKSKYAVVEHKLTSIQFPEKYKDTFLERWVTYWKFFLKDYKDAIIGVRNEFRDKPTKCWIYVTGIVMTTYLAKNNPDETSFREELLRHANQVMLVSPACQNPVTTHHLTFTERCFNEGLLRRVNIGVCSFMWVDDYDKACALYKATCEYLQPEYLSFSDRILDIGFLNKWWNLQKKMIDYDVNF